MTRRTFNLGIAGAASALLAGPVRAQRKNVFPEGIYVDVHTHLGQEWGARPALSVGDLLRWMDEHRVSQSVVLPLVSPESWDHPISTDYVLRETQGHRDRLIPFCSIDPRTINLGTYEAKRDLLVRYVEAGAKGFGEHKPGIAIDGPRNLELFAACSELRLPILFHLDTQRNMDKPGLPGLAKALKSAPNAPFIGHAQGWWASISGDIGPVEMQQYPKKKVAAGGAIDALMDAFPNLYGDLSAGSGANAISRDTEFGRDFLIRRADRLLFGTDYLAPGQAVPQFELYESLALPRAVERKIFRDNARRLLGLSPS